MTTVTAEQGIVFSVNSTLHGMDGGGHEHVTLNTSCMMAHTYTHTHYTQ